MAVTTLDYFLDILLLLTASDTDDAILRHDDDEFSYPLACIALLMFQYDSDQTEVTE